MKVKDLEPVLQETKEQIRTELINELIGWNDKYFTNVNDTCWHMLNTKLQSLLPLETPEKIAERKAVEIMNKNGWMDIGNTKSVLIEALLTDIKK